MINSAWSGLWAAAAILLAGCGDTDIDLTQIDAITNLKCEDHSGEKTYVAVDGTEIEPYKQYLIRIKGSWKKNRTIIGKTPMCSGEHSMVFLFGETHLVNLGISGTGPDALLCFNHGYTKQIDLPAYQQFKSLCRIDD